MSRNFVYQKRWYAESTIDTKHRGSPGRIAMCIFRSTPSSEKFCLHALPFIGDIYRLILLFHSSKFKHLNVPVPYRRPCGHKADNWIGEAPRNVRFRLASFLLNPNISLVFSQLFSVSPVPRMTLPILSRLLCRTLDNLYITYSTYIRDNSSNNENRTTFRSMYFRLKRK